LPEAALSLPADIIQLIGTSSVPVVVAGSVLGGFELGERLASQRAKDALSKWLLLFDVQRAKALPDGTLEIFQRIFGERHFSLKCLIRSAAFSVGAIVFVAILGLLTDPEQVLYGARLDFEPRVIGLWLPWSIVIDYGSLFKTRVILRILTRLKRIEIAIAMLIIDYLVYYLIFLIGVAAVGGSDQVMSDFLHGIIIHSFIPPHLNDEIFVFIFFWSGFAPSIWMWLYVTTLFVTRALLRSERMVNWLRWFLDVEKNPFRSIGGVAAALAFIASVAILLLSAEVSRIGAAA
jgi:hypothetical protein